MMNKLLIASCIGRVTATFSVLGSSSIIYMIISDGKRKLDRPFHRLALFMSIFDVLHSIAMIVATAAIPKESGKDGAKGNSRTCTAQGFFIVLGLAVPLYNSCLNIYYVLTIRYSISFERFAKYEPVLHAIAILVPLSMAIVFTARGEMLPGADVCFPRSKFSMWAVPLLLMVCFLICISSMTCICWTVISQAIKMKKYTRSSLNGNAPRRRSRIKDEKVETTKQALLYASAFILTYFFLVLNMFLVRNREDVPPFIFTILLNIFYPLQGFWNFIFYVRPGIKHVIKASPDKTYLEALRDVIFDPMSTKPRRRRTTDTRRATTPFSISNKNSLSGDAFDAPRPSHQAEDQCSEEISQRQWANSYDEYEEKNIKASFTGLQTKNEQNTSIEVLNETLGDDYLSRMNSNFLDEVCNRFSITETVSATRNQNVIETSNSMPLANVSSSSDDEAGIPEDDLEKQSKVQPHSKPRQRRLSLVYVGSVLSPDDLTSLDIDSDCDDS